MFEIIIMLVAEVESDDGLVLSADEGVGEIFGLGAFVEFFKEARFARTIFASKGNGLGNLVGIGLGGVRRDGLAVWQGKIEFGGTEKWVVGKRN